MLNELYSMSGILSKMSISAKDWHNEYEPIPKVTVKAPCIRIWVDVDGSICRFDCIEAQLATKIRKYGGKSGLAGTFPAFNIAPLYRVTNEQIIKKLNQVEKDNSLLDINTIKSWCTENNWSENLMKKVNNSINISGKLQEIINKTDPLRVNSITSLVNIIHSYEGGKTLREQLEKCIFRKLQAKEDVKTALTILFRKGNPKAKNPEKDSGTLSLLLDYAQWQQYQYPVSSEVTTEWLNDILLRYKAITTETSKDERKDAFGVLLGNVSETMPTARIPFKVTLRAMFRDQLCQKRYGTFDDESFPISQSKRGELKRALEYISSADKEDITWKKVHSEETVFAYPSKLEAIPLKLVSLLGPSSGNKGDHTTARFEKCAEDFIKNFHGIEIQSRPDNIRIFSIRKMDKARSKIVFTRNLSPEWYINCARIWRKGCENVPNIHFIETCTPFPLEVANIINAVWKQNGELATQGKATVKQMQNYQGMELLIDNKSESEIRHYLRIFLANIQGLFAFYGNQCSRPELTKDTKKHFLNARESVATRWPLFGLLLYKIGCKKEVYMKDTAYLVGQLLKVSDELHLMYCMVKRDGDVPPQLAGNSVFISASEMPVKALAVLSQRMNPYIAWAKQYRTQEIKYDPNDVELKENRGKSSGLAVYYLGLYETIAAKLKDTLTPSLRFDDFGKAQVFIGYLAAFPEREKANNEILSITKNEDRGGIMK